MKCWKKTIYSFERRDKFPLNTVKEFEIQLKKNVFIAESLSLPVDNTLRT